MFSKELENLIQATLEDGMLEDYEKAALIKRAQAEGVDLTELEIYIQSILQKRKRELSKEDGARQAKIAKKKKEAMGPVCPKCGKQVPPLTLKCECGYEFVTRNTQSSVEKLSNELAKIMEGYGDENEKNQRIIDLITVFPVPNNKEDIVDFLALAAPVSKYKGGVFGTIPKRLLTLLGVDAVIFLLCLIFVDDRFLLEYVNALCLIGFCVSFPIAIELDPSTLKWNKRADAWRAKFEQVLMKGRSLRGDPEFTQQLDYYERMVNNK